MLTLSGMVLKRTKSEVRPDTLFRFVYSAKKTVPDNVSGTVFSESILEWLLN